MNFKTVTVKVHIIIKKKNENISEMTFETVNCKVFQLKMEFINK